MARTSLTDLMRAVTVERWAESMQAMAKYHALTAQRASIFHQAEARACYRAAYSEHARLGLVSDRGIAFG